MKIIECVPNFSEGCDQEIMASIAQVLRSFAGIQLVNFSGDIDHNRSVFTFLGKPEAVLEAALAAAGRALELIDMQCHTGIHPRIGAVDVVPFIPLSSSRMKDAVDIAHCFGEQFHKRFGVPAYFYGEAALVSQRRELACVRQGGYEGLARNMSLPENAPDVGAPVFIARSGATAVGARLPLVAYNINLASDDLSLAQSIAAQIREKDGGLKYVRAIGIMLKSRGIAQVSVNLVNYTKTPLPVVYDRVRLLAAGRGVEILESELIGLIPAAAFAGREPEYLKLKDYNQECLLETHLNRFVLQQSIAG